MLAYPRMIQLETSTACNGHCRICPNDNLHRKPMGMVRIKHILDQLDSQPVSEIHPFFTNEPLASLQHLRLVLSYVENHMPSTGVYLYTNGSLLTEEAAKMLLRYRCFRYMAFSIDGYRAETRRLMRPGCDPVLVDANIDRFMRLMHEAHRGIHIKAVMTVTRDNEAETDDFNAHWRSKGVNEIMVFGSDGRALMGDGDNKAGTHRQNPRWPCMDMRCTDTNLYILCNGDVVPCCKDATGLTVLGNVFQDSIETIWHGEKYNALRDDLRLGQYDNWAACKACGGK